MTRQLTADRHALVKKIEPWARRAAVRIANKRGKPTFADLAISDALKGAVEAAGTYDLSSKVPYEVYARPRIRGAIRDALKEESKHWPAARLGVQEAAEQVTDPSDVRTDSDNDTEGYIDGLVDEGLAGGLLNLAGEIWRTPGETGLILRETYALMLSALDQSLSRLNATERRLVDLRYYQGLRWEAVAAALGMPLERTKSLARRIRQQLVAALRARGVRSARLMEGRTVLDHA